jgi:hypothetical protein
MRGMLGTVAAFAAVMLVAALAYAAEGPTRAEYVDQVEPICERNTQDNKRILKGARGKVKQGKLAVAGKQFTRASAAFGKTVQNLVAVPRPPEDDARLLKWFRFLRIVKTNLGKIGAALKRGNKVLANHEAIRAERSANAANNVAAIFPFRYCKLTPSRFSGT